MMNPRNRTPNTSFTSALAPAIALAAMVTTALLLPTLFAADAVAGEPSAGPHCVRYDLGPAAGNEPAPQAGEGKIVVDNGRRYWLACPRPAERSDGHRSRRHGSV